MLPLPDGLPPERVGATVHVLDDGESYRALGPASSPQVVVRPRWLAAQGVAPTARELTIAAHGAVVRALLRDLRDRVFPWATDERLAEVGATARITLPAPLGQLPDQITVPVQRSLISGLGLAAGTDMIPYRRPQGLEVWMDRDYLRGLGPTRAGDRTVIRSPALMARLTAVLEAELGAPMRDDVRRALASQPFQLAGDLDGSGRIYFHVIPEGSLVLAFGEPAVRAYRARTAHAADGEAVVRGPAGNVTLPAGTSAEDRARVERLLRELYGDRGAATPTALTTADVAALRQLDADPDRAEILALVRGARGRGGAGDPRQTVADLIETVRAQVDLHRAPVAAPLARTAHTPPVPRPVRGHVRNRSGELVPGMEARFDFVEDDGEDRFVVPLVIIRWAARRTHDVQVDADGRHPQRRALPAPIEVATERTHYVATEPQCLGHDRIFNFRVRDPGIYEIHAIVDHAFYYPAHFRLTGDVEVLPERGRHREREDRAFAGLAVGPTTTEDHQFDVLRYGAGQRTRGQLSASALATPAGQGNVASVDDELRQLRALERQYAHSDDDNARAILTYVHTRIVHLEDARGGLAATLADRANIVVRTWGTYTSRTAGVDGGDLRLVTWLRNPGGGRVEGHLLDHTQLHEAQNYQLAETGNEREAVLEALFVALTRAYPEGTLTVRFEVPGRGGQFVEYRRQTDTLRRDVTGVVFSQPVAIAVNLTALVVGIFNPLAGVAISVAYNTAQTADDLSQQSARGTLTWQHTATSLGLLAIDLLPAAGMTSRVIQLGRVGYVAIEATQLAGSVLLVAPDAVAQIAQLREGRIRELARLEDTIRTRRANNPSDAQLRELEDQARALRADIESTGRALIADLVTRQLVVVAAGAVIGAAARRQLGERVRGTAIHDPAAIARGDDLHVPVGRSMTRADGDAALAGLARGDRGALVAAGVDALPASFDPGSVRWGLAELPDGEVIVVRGGADGVDWSQLPAGIRRIGETPPRANAAPAAAEGTGTGTGTGPGTGTGTGSATRSAPATRVRRAAGRGTRCRVPGAQRTGARTSPAPRRAAAVAPCGRGPHSYPPGVAADPATCRRGRGARARARA